MVVLALVFFVNAILTLWWDWPGAFAFLNHIGVPGFSEYATALTGTAVALGAGQALSYPIALVAVIWWIGRQQGSIDRDAALYSGFAALVVRTAFWSAVLIGVADAAISFVRVEGLMSGLFSEKLASNLGLSTFRGNYVHYPLMVIAFVIAALTRSLSFVWLALLVVLAEFQIVISRFVFSYEQAFMGDLVRFWYSGLFLIASAHTLVEEGHVRVDVLYARLSERSKAWANVAGCTFLGLPLCWTILIIGMWSKGSSLSSPLLNFEISQSGYGMYVKYLMAGFLVVFAVSMIIQFSSYLLSNGSILTSSRTESAQDHSGVTQR
ncbi:MAG: TRAP transporter small permease subunit [Gammaproteobacteria bacterium]|nr:TRAP transporter small permease subunit [Gammaproteobacteria bacterium]